MRRHSLRASLGDVGAIRLNAVNLSPSRDPGTVRLCPGLSIASNASAVWRLPFTSYAIVRHGVWGGTCKAKEGCGRAQNSNNLHGEVTYSV
ncbi:hypothetical protein J3459_017309 [Metarhizium acridum]|nr:hypothetical protein J3459_017309 [Metarhizium acridum]